MPYIPNLLQNVIGRGPLASRPAALMAGRLWFATDESVVYRDNGTGWDAISLGEVTSVDGLTGDVDLSTSYLGIDDAATTYLTQADAATTYLTPAAADLAYDPLGIAGTEVSTHNASEAAHATLFGLKADAEKPGPTIAQGYEEDGTNREVAAADTSYELLPSLSPLDPLTPANDSWSIATYVSAATAGLDIEVRATITESGTGTPYSATTTVTTTTIDMTGWDCNAAFLATDFGLPYPYPQIDSVLWEWRLPNGEGGHIYSGARSISWIAPNIPVAYMDDVNTAVATGVAAHNVAPLAHPDLLSALDQKANATKTGATIEYDIHNTLVARTNTSPDASWADIVPQTPLLGGETPGGNWSVTVALSADTNAIPVDIRVTAYEVGTGIPYTAVKPYTETTAPDTSGEATYLVFDVADFDFGVVPAPACDEIQIEWAVPGGETIELYSAWSRMALPGAPETVVYTDDLSAAITTHEAAVDPHPGYLTAAEGDAAYEALGAAAAAVTAHEAAANPHPGYLTAAEGDAAYELIGTADAAVAAHNIDPLAHVDLFDAKANFFKPGLPLEFNIYNTLVPRTNTAPDTSWSNVFAQAPIPSGETPEGGWSVAVSLSTDIAAIPIDVRVTVYEVGTGTPYDAVKSYTESSPNTTGDSAFLSFAVADFDFGVTPAPMCDEIKIEWSVPGGETVGLYSAWALMVFEAAADTVVYTDGLASAIADHEAAADPHPGYLTEAEGDAAYVLQIEKGAALGVATLDASGFVPADQLPGLALTSTFVVGSQALMLGLPADAGDICVRTDLNETYVLDGTGDPAALANWVHLLSPTDAVASVDGRTGVVTLNDLYDASGAAASAVSTHNGATTSVHGITNTANLVYTSDSRLSDARTPAAHAASHNAGGSDALAIDAAAGIGSLRTLGVSATSAAAGNDARLSDPRYPNATYWEEFELLEYGKSNTLATFGLSQSNANQIGMGNNQFRWSFVRANRALTVSKLTFATTAATGLTGYQLGIYTTTPSGSAWNVTLVARTSATAFTGNLAQGIYTASLDTTGGFPATYTLNAGQLYAFAAIANATTSTGNILAKANTSQLGALLIPGGDNSGLGSTALPTSSTNRSSGNTMVWIRAEV